MKLLVGGLTAGALVAVHAENGKLGGLSSMAGVSDECEGCDVAPDPIYTCENPPCDTEVCGHMPIIKDHCEDNVCTVDCSLEYGYYPDKEDCHAFCFCAGTDNVSEGTGIRVPSKYAVCPEGTVYDPSCQNYHKQLANGLGWFGGCCDHPRNILDFPNCPNACPYLTKYHCDLSETCCWNEDCNCCQTCGPPPSTKEPPVTTTTPEPTTTTPPPTTTTPEPTTTTTTTQPTTTTEPPTTSPTPSPTPGTTTTPEPIQPVQSNEIYQYYPANWEQPGRFNEALGHKYGLIFLADRNEAGAGIGSTAGEITRVTGNFARKKLVGIIDGTWDPMANGGTGNFIVGSVGYRCRVGDIRQGIPLGVEGIDNETEANAVAKYGCGAITRGSNSGRRGETKFAEWKLSSLSGQIEIERKITKKKK